MSTASIETELKVINESDTLHDTGLGSSPESRTDKLSSYCTRADSEHTLAGKRNPVKDNLDSAGESKLSDKKILQNNENTYLLSEDGKRFKNRCAWVDSSYIFYCFSTQKDIKLVLG